MEWRCEWCGKPHEADDPPCDNCGHGKFEKAIVRQPEATDGPASTLVWVCPDCGREHPKNSPPCSRCNNPTLERTEKVVTDEDLTAAPGSAPSRQPASTMTVWSCPECGEEHPTNSPPCNNCGHMGLERTEKTMDDEFGTPSYLDVLTPTYAVALVLVLLVAGVFVLGVAGIVDVPFLSAGDVPEVADVPGDATATEEGISLAAVESAYLEDVNEERRANDREPLVRSDRLDDIATFDNQQRVRAAVDGDERSIDDETARELLRDECELAARDTYTQTTEPGTDAATLAEGFPTAAAAGGFEEQDAEVTFDAIGLDAHAVDGEVSLRVILCSS